MTAKNSSKKRISPATGLPVRKYTKQARKATKYTGYSVAERLFGPDPPQKKRAKQAKSEKSVKGAPTSFKYTTPPGTQTWGHVGPLGWESVRVTGATTLERGPVDGTTNAAPTPPAAPIPWSQQLGTLFARVEELESQIEERQQEITRLLPLLYNAQEERAKLLKSKGMKLSSMTTTELEQQ